MLADNIILCVASYLFNISLKMTFFSIILVKLVDFLVMRIEKLEFVSN